MVTDRCTLTELVTTDCAHCKGIPDGAPRRLGQSFTAFYPGRCADCGTPFDAGQPIRADGEGGYVATCCADDTPTGGHDGPH